MSTVWGTIMLVFGTFNGQPSMASTAFNSPELCLAYRRQIKKEDHRITLVKCVPNRGTI